ncbi:hypothetical protein LIER_01077 [Lithospermum erythrorhizon]|uniref:SWIM-type domain-containing protein n=1 Tax=Lithospermum erythrorhizon TaxID=34254 RepID=A0AAV3NPG4_LITER
MLNTIYHTIMARIEEERENKEKWKGLVCLRVDELLKKKSKRNEEYITRSSGSPRYEVSSADHSFVVDIEKKSCACGLWQLGEVSCVHAVDKAEKAATEKAKKAKIEGVFKASRRGAVIHYKICSAPSHNARTCRRRPGLTFLSQPAALHLQLNLELQPSLFYRHNHHQPDVERRNRIAVLQDYLDYPPTPF